MADDLGYGDLGFAPFTSREMGGLKTPSLERMSRRGLSMVSYHVAAPMCSPSRASLLTGLFPWRFGVDFIYSQDVKKDGSQEMDHEQLPLVANIAMALRDSGYHTAHVGKWHLGGLSNYDIAGRANHSEGPCFVPGPQQYGFDEWVGMTEGWEGKVAGKVWSSRSRTHEEGNTYSTGARYMIRNDVPLPRRAADQCLTDRQTDEGMRVISEQTARQRPFFLNLWFDAPHSPWEPIEPFYSQYQGQFASQTLLRKYASMVSNMDMNIGRVLDLVDSLGITSNTLILFTSDNGPENGAGFTGGLKGRKRLLTEGGIRVPCIWQWTGHIEAGTLSDKFTLSTDVFPTLLHAARERFPGHARVDGFSLLPVLLAGGRSPPSSAPKLLPGIGDERVALWYAHAPDYPKLAAAVSHGLKVLWNDYEDRRATNLPPRLRVFDLRLDPKEDVNLLPALLRACGDGAGKEVSWRDVQALDHGELRALASRPAADWASSSALAHTALRLVTHLYLRMHLFRHLGDVDWRRYHENKPFERQPSCAIRTVATAETIHFGEGIVLAPEFCGEGVYAAAAGLGRGGRGGCACSIGECGSRWKKGGGWEEGVIASGLSGFAPESAGVSDANSWPQAWTEHTYLLQVLRRSRYRGVCPAAPLVDSAYESTLKAAGVGVRPTECGGGMAASLWLNHVGMFAPLPLCPKGLGALAGSGLDSGTLHVVLSDVLFSTERELRLSVAKLLMLDGGNAKSKPTLTHRSLALLDDLEAQAPSQLSHRLDSAVSGPLLLSFLPLRLNSSAAWTLAASVAVPAARSARVVLFGTEGEPRARAVYSRAYVAAGFAVSFESVASKGPGAARDASIQVVHQVAQALALVSGEGPDGLSARRLEGLAAPAESHLAAWRLELAALYRHRGQQAWSKTAAYLDLMSKKGAH